MCKRKAERNKRAGPAKQACRSNCQDVHAGGSRNKALSLAGECRHQLIDEPVRSQQARPSLVPTLQCQVLQGCVPSVPALLPAGQHVAS